MGHYANILLFTFLIFFQYLDAIELYPFGPENGDHKFSPNFENLTVVNLCVLIRNLVVNNENVILAVISFYSFSYCV